MGDNLCGTSELLNIVERLRVLAGGSVAEARHVAHEGDVGIGKCRHPVVGNQHMHLRGRVGHEACAVPRHVGSLGNAPHVGDVVQACESIIAKGRYRRRQRESGEARAAVEGVGTDGGDTIGQVDTGQGGAAGKGTLVNGSNVAAEDGVALARLGIEEIAQKGGGTREVVSTESTDRTGGGILNLCQVAYEGGIGIGELRLPCINVKDVHLRRLLGLEVVVALRPRQRDGVRQAIDIGHAEAIAECLVFPCGKGRRKHDGLNIRQTVE